MNSKSNFLLVTDSSHPEIFALANQLCLRNVRFTLISSLVFTKGESHILTRLPFVPQAIKRQILARTLNASPHLTTLIRTKPLDDLVAKFLNRLPNELRGHWWVKSVAGIDKRLHLSYSYTANKIMKKKQFSHVVYQSSLKIETKNESVIPVEIAYHGNESQELYWKNIASLQYPEWETSWKISTVAKVDSKESNEHLVSPKKIVYASSFNASFSENSIQSFYSPLAAIKTGEFLPKMKSEETSLIHIGQIGLRKGIPIILDVANRVSANITLCGSGSADVISKIMIEKSPNIDLILAPNDRDIRTKLISSQAFILPSYYEGFGIAILEAMSYGCIPIVSRNTCGPDILSGTELERFLIPAGSVSALEEAIQKLIELERSERLFLGEMAATLSKKFTFSGYADRILDSLFTELI